MYKIKAEIQYVNDTKRIVYLDSNSNYIKAKHRLIELKRDWYNKSKVIVHKIWIENKYEERIYIDYRDVSTQ